ncbi:MAG TPA: hypothetical protein VI757_16090 [Bacteroidia bacterium]|nr:hypothetical protein [Bacteroidia bacterium]
MSDRPAHLIIQDMLDSISDILAYTQGMSRNDFMPTRKPAMQ